MYTAFNKFKYLRIEGWRQFGKIEIDIHPRLTVITGANGAGKSSLLRIFSRHFGFDRPFLATPMRSSEGTYIYSTGLFAGALSKIWKNVFNIHKQVDNEIGVLQYTSGIDSKISVPDQSSVQYSVNIYNQQSVNGIHVDSHQPINVFQQVSQIPTNIISPATAYQNYNNEMVQKYSGYVSHTSPIYKMKEAIIAMAMFGEGNSYIHPNLEVLSAYKGFIDILIKILPESLGFMDISIRPPEVVLVTKSGEFLMDASSGGIMTIIDLTWRLYMFSTIHKEFVVTIDEPENHLHPTIQRSLMRRLLNAFPTAQFIIATHSPFMVSSVKESNVYVLRYANDKTGDIQNEQVMPSQTSRVVSDFLDTINKAGSASEILRDVLGVGATLPEWVEEQISIMISRYRDTPIDKAMLKNIRDELSEMGCGEFYPDALSILTENR